MKLFTIFEIILIFYSVSTSAEPRISDIKCLEYSAIPYDRSQPQPHLVWLRIATEDVIVVGVLGTLISKNFVLTSAVSNLIVDSSQVYFTPDEQYTIVERFTHPLFGGTAHHDIALLKLERPVVLDSFHRPACLWTSKDFKSTTVELVHWNSATWKNDFEIKTLNVVSGSGCTNLHSQQNESLICTKPIAAEDHQYIPSPGSPIQVYRPNADWSDNYFIYGIFSFFYYNADPYINVGTKTFVHLNWIESHVWNAQQYEDEVCGTVIESSPIVNSQTTFPGEFPWHTVIYELVAVGERRYKCEGILVNELTVLTAASCHSAPLTSRTTGSLIAIMGLHDLEMMTDRRQEIRVHRIIKQYQFDENTLENNLALLKLRSVVHFTDYVKPICLSSNALLFENRTAVLPGWGQMDFDMDTSTLSKGFLSIRNTTGNSFSAQYENKIGACSGSLGGGLVIKVHERWYLKGIVSHVSTSVGQVRCDLSAPVLLTDTVKWYKWIQQNL